MAEMRQILREDHRLDADGHPSGGFTLGTGIDIKWQDGPVGPGEAPNGAFIEGVVQAAMGRLQFFQMAENGRYACAQNEEALRCLEWALAALDQRTSARQARGVEGTYEP
jgi:hypothetical protein